MSQYMRVRTGSGRRYSVRMAEDERAGRFLYWFSLVTMTFVSAAGMFLLWIKMGA